MCTKEVNSSLKSLNATDVVLFGIEAHVCIYQTTLDLLESNYKVHLLVDGISSRHVFEKDWALNELQKSGAFLGSSENTLFQILGDFNHAKAKEISKIVKETDLIYASNL